MFTKPLLVCLFSAGVLATAHPAQAQEETKSADYGLGVNARQLQLTRGLAEVGFAQDDIDKVMGNNWLRFFEHSFGPASQECSTTTT